MRVEKHWETIPQGTGAAWGLLIAVRAGAGSPASIGSSRPVEMGKHMEVLNWRMGDKILSLCVFPGSWCPTVCCSFPWILVSSYSWQHGESVGGINSAASAEMSSVTRRIWQYWEKKMKESL